MSELPARRRRPNHGALSPGAMVSSHSETSASSTAVGLRSTPYTLCRAMYAFTRWSSVEYCSGSIRSPSLLLAAGEVLTSELPHGFDGEGARAEGRLADRHVEYLRGGGASAADRVVVEVLVVEDLCALRQLGLVGDHGVQEFGEALGDGEGGDDFRGVVARGLLAGAAGEAEHEFAVAVGAGDFLAHLVLDHHEVCLHRVVDTVEGHHPGAVLGLAVAGYLHQLLHPRRNRCNS